MISESRDFETESWDSETSQENSFLIIHIAILSATVRWIEILRARYALQLLILSTRTHFQRVSEHYMVTRMFLSILTLERGPACAPYNSTIGVQW